MSYESYCAACTYLGETADYEGKYYCDSKGEDHYACDPKCYNFCEAFGRSNSARANMFDNSRNHCSSSSSSYEDSSYSLCYLTTAMCNILGYKDDDYYLQTLRNFRDNILQNNSKYIPLLNMYDIIGPEIAYKLNKDTNKEIIAKHLFNGYITKAVDAINEEKIQEAVNIYIAMTHTLADRYNININILYISPQSIIPNNIDINSLGHGKSRTRKRLEKSL